MFILCLITSRMFCVFVSLDRLFGIVVSTSDCHPRGPRHRTPRSTRVEFSIIFSGHISTASDTTKGTNSFDIPPPSLIWHHETQSTEFLAKEMSHSHIDPRLCPRNFSWSVGSGKGSPPCPLSLCGKKSMYVIHSLIPSPDRSWLCKARAAWVT